MLEQSLALPVRGLALLARGFVLVLATSLLAGCASPPAAEQPEPRALGADLPAYAAPRALPSPAPPGPPLPEEPQGAIGLPEALAAALLRNPDLAAFSWEVRSREALALQAGLLPNPELGVEIENFAGSGPTSGFDQNEATFLLAQLIETAGKRSKRREAAKLGADVAAWEYEKARLDVFASVESAFFDVLAAQEQVALSEELVRVAASSVDAVERLVSAGATPRAERTRAAVEAATARVDLATGRRALQSARAALAATWGSSSAAFTRAEGDLGSVAAPPDRETARGWLAENPELERWDREIARREAVVALEDARRIPDVVVAAGPRRLEESNDTALVAGLSVPLPIFDRNQGTRAAARSDLRKAEHEKRAVQARLAAGLEAAYQELAARFDEVTRLREEILPGADAAFEQVRQGYAQGLFRNVDVLDAQRRLSELRLRELEALRAYHQAKAEVERLTGTPLSSSPPAP
jgi:cobalt-zinc-cadmium efflux system outer membrane protein